MATATLCLPPSPTRFLALKPTLPLSSRSPILRLHSLHSRRTALSKSNTIPFAYVTGPASDPIFSECDPKIDGLGSLPEKAQPPSVISSGLLWQLLMKHKLRLAVLLAALIGCSSCTLSMPLFSGKEGELIQFALALLFG